MNEAIFFFFYNLAHHSDFFDKVVVFSAVYLPYMVILGAAVFIFFHRKSWKDLGLVFFGSCSAWVVSKILKILLAVPRPFEALPNVQKLLVDDTFSFPSGHATFFAALATSIFFYHRKAGYVFFVLALIIGIARIVAGVHYPFDILAGFIIGSLVAYLLKSS